LVRMRLTASVGDTGQYDRRDLDDMLAGAR
jgi:hypothetical protein